MNSLKRTILTSILLALSLSVGVANAATATCKPEWPASDFQQHPFGVKTPNYGLYWYNTAHVANNTPLQTMAACHTTDSSQKVACMAKLESAGFFDPSRPTIIFIHGWSPGSVSGKQRFDFCYNYPTSKNTTSPNYNVLQSWRGWNVGVIYWNQFADDDLLKAEAKIYTTQAPHGMRWRYLGMQGQEHYCDAHDSSCVMPRDAKGNLQTILQMAYQAYQQGMPAKQNFHGSELRIVGQSLGTQLAIQLTDQVVHNAALPQPTRLALMDPYFSPNDPIINKMNHLPLEGVANYNTEKVSDIEQTAPHLPIAVYRTSTLSTSWHGDPAPQLMAQVAFMRLFPNYIHSATGMTLQGLYHKASVYLYFYSKKSSPSVTQGNDAYINAAANNDEVLTLMRQSRFQQPSLAETHFVDTQDERFTNAIPTHFKK